MQHWNKAGIIIRNQYKLLIILVATIILVIYARKRSQNDVQLRELQPIERERLRKVCFKHLEDAMLTALKPIFENSSRTILASTIVHRNLGDSFIWIGVEIILQRLNYTVVYRCPTPKCTVNKIKNYLTVNDGTIVSFNGGGNFGDLYSREMGLKMTLVQNFGDRRMVFFPQSVFYRSKTLMKEDAAKLSSHPDLHIMVRSEDSFTALQKNFDENHRYYLVPDAAFMLGSIIPMCEPSFDVIFLKRSDAESIVSSGSTKSILREFEKEGISFQIFDWFDAPAYVFSSKYWTGYRTDNMLPIQALEMANYLLSRGRVIVSDRLHATILSFLIDRPVVYLDNSYGKVRSVTKVLQQWSECESFRRCFASDTKTVLECVKRFLSEVPPIRKSKKCEFRMRPIYPSLIPRLENISLY